MPQLNDPLEPRLAGDSVHRRLLLRCRLWRRPPMRFSVGFCVGFCMGLWVRLRVGLRHGLGARLRLGCLAAAVAAGHRLRGRLARGRPGGRHWDDPAVRCGASRRRRRRHCGWGRGWDWSAREERRRACRRHGAGRPASHCHWSHMALWRLSCVGRTIDGTAGRSVITAGTRTIQAIPDLAEEPHNRPQAWKSPVQRPDVEHALNLSGAEAVTAHVVRIVHVVPA